MNLTRDLTQLECPYCGTWQDQPTGVLKCVKCGGNMQPLKEDQSTVTARVKQKVNNIFCLADSIDPSEQATAVDISKWQGPMNFAITKTKVDLVIIRSSYGIHVDSKYEENLLGCFDHMIPVSSYHYTYPGINSAKAEAATFSDMMLGINDIGLNWADAENHGNLTKSALSLWYYIFINTVQDRTGKELGIYTRQSYWDYFTQAESWMGSKKLWGARYAGHLTSPWSDGYYKFRDWSDWWSHQYSETGDGPGYGASSPKIDLNRLNMTKAQFLQTYVNGDVDPPPREEITLSSGTYTFKVNGDLTITKI